MIGAFLVTAFGGISVKGIRPLFFIALAGTAVTFLLIYFYLSNDNRMQITRYHPHVLKEISQVLTKGHHVKRWLIIVSIGTLPLGMLFPFSTVFAHEIKGADQYVLGLMVTGCALTPLLLGIPMGRLADKVGRKKVLFILLPLFWSSNLILIWSSRPVFLIVSGFLQGFYYICATVTEAMTFELVPSDQLGRWLGLTSLCYLLLGAFTASIAGIIWDKIGPQYVFITLMGVDILIRLPLLIGMPETLGLSNE
jgi:MFS family permease